MYNVGCGSVVNTVTCFRGIYRGVELLGHRMCARSLPADTARCSILCGGHVEFLSIHVPQSHSPLAVFPLMGVYLFVPLASSKKELSHQETGHSA